MTSPAEETLPPAERSEPSLEIILDSGETRTSVPGELPALGRIGRYELLGRMAVGGMAEIYLARERASAGGSRHLVVKVIRRQLENAADYEAMFLNEGRLALRLSHPNICHLYEFGTERGRIFIAMELVHGTSLRDLVRRAGRAEGGLPMPILVRIVSQVAEALHAAHTATGENGQPLNIVHRDVSPHNVMVSYDGVVKLLDFGVASASTPLGELEESGTIKGKFGYLAPEQCLGEPIDARADIFSLGVCLWEGLTGRRLFKRGGEYETLHAIVREDVPLPHDLGVDVPGELEAIVQKALAKKPEDRFQTAAEMQEALEAFLTERRELVNTPRLARYLSNLFGEEIEAGPKLDCQPRLFAWAAASEDPEEPEASKAAVSAAATSSGSRRGAWLALAVAALLVAGVAGWQGWEGEMASDPTVAARTEGDRSARGAAAAPPGSEAEAERAADEVTASDALEGPDSEASTEVAAEVAAEEVDGTSGREEATGPEEEAVEDVEDVVEDAHTERTRRARRELRQKVRRGAFVEDPGF